MLDTREKFLAFIESHKRSLSPEEEPAERRAFSEAAMNFRRALAETTAQATEAFVKTARSAAEAGKWTHDLYAQARKLTEAAAEMTRSATEAEKWIVDAQHDVAKWTVTFKNSQALQRRLFEPPSFTLTCAEIATSSMQLQKSMARLALSTAAATKISLNLSQCAMLDLTKTIGGILGIPTPLESFRRLCGGFSPPKTPKLTRRSNGRPNYIEYAAEIDKLPTTGFWSSIQLFYGRNSYYGDLWVANSATP